MTTASPTASPAATHTIVMTGAGRGLGRIAAERILAGDPSAHLLVIARGDSGVALATALSAGSAKAGRVSSLSADLGSLASVRAMGARIVTMLESGQLPPLTGFVGNAGIQYANATTVGPDGFESTFTVNVLANHVLIRTLQDHFVAPARITITASDAHFGDLRHNLGIMPAPAWQPPEVLARASAFAKSSTVAAGMTAYSTSKLAVIHLVHEFARRLPAGVTIVSFNPGFVPATGLARNANRLSQFLMARVMPLLVLTPLAINQADAGGHLADVVLGNTTTSTGDYVDRAAVAPSSDASYNPAREAELWEAAEKLTAVTV
ncbi:MAG: short-chain dehydrogenase [Glaciihabitans sp.]|nr:short-chain dehydrogenase [Glaciihabitans sp.]